MTNLEDTTSTGDYRLTRLESEVSDLRSKLEAGQAAMLQAVASLGQQLVQFQINLATDLSAKYVSQREHADIQREFRERAGAAEVRLDKYDAVYIKALDEARRVAEVKRNEDAERSLRINLALFTSAASATAAFALHFIKF